MAEAAWLDGALATLTRARVAVFGDFALDAYWTLRTGHGEVSVETGLDVQRVQQQRYQAGGAGNVVANLMALGVAEVHAIGLHGSDPFAAELRQSLIALGARCDQLLPAFDPWHTLVFAKPLLAEAEQGRFDFGSDNRLGEQDVARLLAALTKVSRSVDVVVVNQQVPGGVLTPATIDGINQLAAQRGGTTFLVDARDGAERFRGALVKLNDYEAARWCGAARPRSVAVEPQEAQRFAQAIHAQTEQPVFVTRGADGMLVAAQGALTFVPGIDVGGDVDPVGAGDTATAALAALLAVANAPVDAARLANLAAAVTVTKLLTTGTANPTEIRALAAQQRSPRLQSPKDRDA